MPARFRGEAASDVTSATEWYNQQRDGLGAEFLAALGQVIDLILERPHAFPEVTKDVRRALVRRFPYAVYYRTSAEFVDVVACLHTRRSSSMWRSRR